MVTSINLGSFSTENGRTVLSGSASGLDTKGLIDGLTTAKRLPAVQLEDKIKQNAARSDAYAELKTILNNFRSISDFLRNPPGVNNEDKDAFSYRMTSVSHSGSETGSNFIKVTAAAGAATSSIGITVDSLATYNVKLTNTFSVTDENTTVVGAAMPFVPGTLTLGASGVNVTLSGGDTLNQVVAKINAVKQQSNVEASIIKVSNGNFRLSLRTMDTGTNQNYTLNAPSLAVFSMGFASQIDAVNAQITLDGTTTVQRQNNSFDDVLPDLSFELIQKTAIGDSLTVKVEEDKDQVFEAISGFVNRYNEFRVFLAKQTELDDNGKPKDTAILASSSTLRSVAARINAEIAGIVEGISGGDPDRLTDIGLKFTDFSGDADNPATKNIIQIDEADLRAAISSNFDAVRRIFTFDYTTDNPDISVFSRNNSLAVSSVTLSIDHTNGVYQATYMDGATPVTINMDARAMSGSVPGLVLTGQAGTVLEGLTLLYTSLSDDLSIDLDLTQGVGDRLYNSLDAVLDDDSGMLTTELESIDDQNTRMQNEIDRIDQIVSDYRETLLEQFSALEASISKANLLLQSLAANSAAQNSNN